MHNGLLIYNPEDYEKNKWFVEQLLTQGLEHGLSIKFILRNELSLGISTEDGFVAYTTENPAVPIAKPDFVINRTRCSIISAHFEKMGCRVFNSAEITRICNHKGLTHQLVNSHPMIPCVPTLICNRDYFNPLLIPFNYPVILKSVGGHGGSEVYMIENQEELLDKLKVLPTCEFILQQPCTNPGKDIRVFSLGGQIVGAVKRFCPTSFKSNYSLGGTATKYTLKPHEVELVMSILKLLPFDFVGIDFILDENDHFLFNEIEDVVGTRTLYLNYPDIDIVQLFLCYIADCLKS